MEVIGEYECPKCSQLGHEVSNNDIPSEVWSSHITTNLRRREPEAIPDLSPKFPTITREEVFTSNVSSLEDPLFPIFPFPESRQLSEPVSKLLPIIVFDDKIQEKVLSEQVYRTIIGAVEAQIRSHENWRTYNFHFSLEQDVELPDWKKTKIKIHFGKIEFNEMMTLWDEIDAEIRKAVAKVKSRLSDQEKQITDINKTLFTSTELIEVDENFGTF